MLNRPARTALGELWDTLRDAPDRRAAQVCLAWLRWQAEGKRHPTTTVDPVLVSIDLLAQVVPVQSPRISIVVPVYNHGATALQCLRSIAGAAGEPSWELIVIDDASTDARVQELATIPVVRYHRNQANLGFVGACNAGAEMARGDTVVFLNSDTLVTPGWLEPLVSALDEPGVGLVGARLHYPSGSLQEAGGLVFADGSGWNYGRGGNPDDPRYGYRRTAHYCSGAAIAIRRDFFHSLGGFDPHFAPGYYEDTDLAMRIRASGRCVVHEPRSRVVHIEGVSAGTDLGQGMKASQVVNRGKFTRRWQRELATGHPAPGTPADLAVRQQSLNWLVAVVPDVGLNARGRSLLAELLDAGCAVDVLVPSEATGVDELRQAGACVWTPEWNATFQWLLLRHGHAVDGILSDGSQATAGILEMLSRKSCGAAPLLFGWLAEAAGVLALLDRTP